MSGVSAYEKPPNREQSKRAPSPLAASVSATSFDNGSSRVALNTDGRAIPGFAIAMTGLISPLMVLTNRRAARAPVSHISVCGE